VRSSALRGGSARPRPAAPALLLPAALGLLLLAPLATPATAGAGTPNVLLITIDTLRADHVSSYGYHRPTTPELDRLLAAGVRFTDARTVEPLTGPSLCSLLTSIHPHEHGATRNGLPMRPRLPSLPKYLRRAGYSTAAFVGNWTLRDRLTGLGEHFETYGEIFSRRRWFLFNREATAEDLNEAALDWMEEHRKREPERPYLLWVHYVEPHAPYRLHKEFAPPLGISLDAEVISRPDRYDTEVAYVDHQVGRLLAALEKMGAMADTLVVFASDHGESLGEHDYWGHGRNVYENNLAIPMGLAWAGHLAAGREISAPALIIDLAPTVLDLLGVEGGKGMRGYDWGPVLRGQAAPPADRLSGFQAHKGAVTGAGDADRAREKGLLEVAILRGGKKEVLRVKTGVRRLFDVAADPGELGSLVAPDSPPSPELKAWLDLVEKGLKAAGDLPVGPLDDESLKKMRALGYVD
jgi:choline-sulfatase